MDVVIQMLLPLIYVVFTQGHVIDPLKPFFNHHHLGLHHLNDPKGASEDRPINGDIFSYNNQHAYNRFYHDGDYNPALGMVPYFGFPGPFGLNNFDRPYGHNMPYGIPNIDDEYIPGRYPHHIDHPQSSGEEPDRTEEGRRSGEGKDHHEKPLEEEKPKHEDDPQKLEDRPPKTNKDSENKDDKGDKKDKVTLDSKKDFLVVDKNGNGVYILHENTPNPIVVPNNNQPAGSNIVYMPYNPQQPGTPVYQVVNGQPPSNTPLTANRLDLNGFSNLVAPAQPSADGKNPSYVLIYANGQLIQIPGVVINPGQNGNPSTTVAVPNNNVPLPNTNVPLPNSNTPNYAYYTNPQNEGNNPILVEVANPNNVQPSNNNLLPNNVYGVNTQPNAQPAQLMPQPSNNGMVYGQPIVNTNSGNPGSTMITNPSAAGNNPSIQPALALPVNNNQNNYSPAQEKDPNAPASNQPGNLQPNEQPPLVNSNPIDTSNNYGAQPAIMVSGFKESEDGKDKKDKKDKKVKKNKDKKKK